jgi:transporter family protein
MVISDALVFGLFAMLAWGVGDFFMKLAADKFGTLRTQFVQFIFGLIIALILIYSFFPVPEFRWTHQLILLFIPFSILNIGGLLAYIEALRRGPVSLVAPISSIYPIITAVLSVIFLKEYITFIQWIAIFIVVAGVMLTSFSSFKKKASLSGIPFAIASFLMWGVLFVLFKPIVVQMGPILPSLIVDAIGLVLLPIWLMQRGELSIPKVTINRWAALMLTVVILGLAYPIFAIGLRISNASIITAISSTYPAVIIILSVIFLKEKLHWWQILGIFTIIIGMVLLG